MINAMRQQSVKISTLEKDNEERKAKEVTQQRDEDNTPILLGNRLMLTAGPGGPMQYSNGIAPQATGYSGF
jgi:clathrin heavy chain